MSLASERVELAPITPPVLRAADGPDGAATVAARPALAATPWTPRMAGESWSLPAACAGVSTLVTAAAWSAPTTADQVLLAAHVLLWPLWRKGNEADLLDR